jgi:hypothetical protein
MSALVHAVCNEPLTWVDQQTAVEGLRRAGEFGQDQLAVVLDIGRNVFVCDL